MSETFFEWYGNVTEKAKATDIGKKMAENGFEVWHTGGGCLAWGKNLAGGYTTMICDDGQGLLGEDSDTEKARWLGGVYDDDGEFVNVEKDTLDEVIAWCAEAAIDPKKFMEERTE